MRFLEREDIVYISRTFSDNRTPDQMKNFSPSERMSLFAISMLGYASKTISPKPLKLSELPGYHDTGREGKYRYTCVVILPPEQALLAKEIQGHSGLTGIEKIDRESATLPLTEIKDNPVIITEFRADRLDPYIIFLVEQEGKRTVIYKGNQIAL